MTETAQTTVSGLPEKRPAGATAAVAYLQVSGMGCSRCADRVRKGLERLHGVPLAEVDVDRRLAAVMYDPQQVTPPDLVQAVAAASTDARDRYRGEFLAQMPTDVAHVGWT